MRGTDHEGGPFMSRKKRPPKLIIGWRETVSLPDLGLDMIPAKIDSGARTTALHAEHIRLIERGGQTLVEFLPDHHALDGADLIARPLVHVREITNTSGVPERRFIIRSMMHLGGRRRETDISLTDRAGMQFPIIIGRRALKGMRLLVDSSKSWTTEVVDP